MQNDNSKKQSSDYQGLSILAAIRLDQARRGLRVVSQADVRRLERQAQQLARETSFVELAGLR